MTDNKPLISVIIPVYNCERYLAEAIKSVLAQTYQPMEIIVVDDGSTDKSAEIAKSFSHKVRYIYQKNSGVASALNHGISLAKGDLFSFLDADDIWVENKLIHQMEILENNPKIDVVFGHARQFISPELDETVTSTVYIPVEIIPGYSKGTMLIKREAFFRVGLFNSQWQVAEFIDWYLQLVEKGLKSFMSSEVLLKRRVHDANMGIRERKTAHSDYVRVLKASLDRRRAK